MKKLLVLATAIVVGVAANAASFSWKASNLYAADLTNKYTGTATLYATIGGVATAVDTFAMTSAGVVNGSFSSETLVAGTAFDFYFTVEDSYGGKDWTYTSKTVTVTGPATGSANIAFGNQATTSRAVVTTAGGNGWYAVPEPTSGLLMLLGMAGFALKRKRA